MGKVVLAILLCSMTASVVGCEDDADSGVVVTVYNAKTDTVECRRVTDIGDMDTWTERGYVCHRMARDRVRP